MKTTHISKDITELRHIQPTESVNRLCNLFRACLNDFELCFMCQIMKNWRSFDPISFYKQIVK